MIFPYKLLGISDALNNELCFDEYINNIQHNIPILMNKQLTLLDEHDISSHYNALNKLAFQIPDKKNITHIMNIVSQLPNLSDTMHAIKNKHIDMHHLHLLSQFIQHDHNLRKIEESLNMRACAAPLITRLSHIINKYTLNNGQELKLPKATQNYYLRLNKINTSISNAITTLEDHIESHTGIRITYPFIREVSTSSPYFKYLKSCKYIHLKKNGHCYQAIIALPSEVKSLYDHANELQAKIITANTQALERIGKRLYSVFKLLRDYYYTRQHHCWLYALIHTIKINHYIIPKIGKKQIIEINDGILPSLKKSHANYVPLTIHLHQKTNILIGANMSGKSTALKTLFFHLCLIKMGLPLPAKSAHVFIPNRIFLQVKGSGDIHSHSSSFSDEIATYSTKFQKNDILLSDELFTSTDPINGNWLATQFLTYFNTLPMFTLISTHFTNLSTLPKINTYCMKDTISKSNKNNCIKMLYQMTHMTQNDHNFTDQQYLKPLHIAMTLSIPEDISKAIERKCDEHKGSHHA